MLRFCILAVLSGLFLPLFGSQTTTVTPLTDRILLVHVDEGYVRHHERGESRDFEWVVGTPLDIGRADLPANYRLQSTDDPSYATATIPSQIGRKSKGTDFTWLCQGWSFQEYFGVVGCDNTLPDHAKEHWLYLFLPEPLQTGAAYTLTLDALVEGEGTYTFVYDEFSNRSEAVHVNQLGYAPAATGKYGYVYQWLGDRGGLDLSTYAGNAFHLYDPVAESIVYTGTMSFRKPADAVETLQDNPGETPNQNFLGAEVYECDFSDFTIPGDYVLVVEGIGTSFSFSIDCDAYRPAYRTVMRGMFMNRSGIELTSVHTAFPRPAPHHPGLTPGFAGRLMYTTTTQCDVSDPEADPADLPLWESGIQGALDATWGWYQDAGDWDAYPSHAAVPAKLLFTYEHFADQFSDEELNIPESGNSLPDILDEARWLLRFYHRVRTELTAKGWSTGGVAGARVMGDLWGEDNPDDVGKGSWEDTERTWIVSGEDPYISYYYAALAAHFAYLLDRDGLADPEGIDWQAEATSAYSWATANASAYDGCTAFELSEARAYAAAALFRLTGSATYEATVGEAFLAADLGSNSLLEELIGFAVYTYLAVPETVANDTYYTAARAALQYTGDYLLTDFSDQRACRWGGNIYFPMLVGQGTTPLVFPGIMAMALLEDTDPARAAAYREVLYTTADYFLGNNPLNMVWITGLGDRSPEDAFHLDSWYSGQAETRPGIVPYGPWLATDNYTNIGPWDHHWAHRTAYPEISEWPGHERWFNQRTSPAAAEFTIHQNQLNAAVLYAALTGDAACSGISSTRRPRTVRNYDLLELAPNPAEDRVRVGEPTKQNTTVVLRIYDASGHLQAVQQIIPGTELEVESWLPGVYLLEEIAADGTRRRGKLVKL